MLWKPCVCLPRWNLWSTFRRFVLERLQPLSTTEELVFKVELVLEEALANVIHYAYPEARREKWKWELPLKRTKGSAFT